MSPLPPDPYKILGVAKDAQISEIRSAHRKLVLKCHPDKVHDPALKAQKQDEFQQVQQAYELLSDEVERQKYDDRVKLEELRKQFQSKANISTPRASPRYSGQDEARGADSRASPFKATTTPSGVKYTYTRSPDEDLERGAYNFDGPPRSSRREATYAEKPSKREMERERERVRERERERDRDARDREREREKEKEKDRERRRRQEDAMRRLEKEAKDARRAEKRAREKQREKDIRRETEDKKRYAKPYSEAYGDDAPASKSDKKKSSSSSKKYDEKRERSSGRDGREDIPTPAAMPSSAPQRSYTHKVDYATSYIQASKAKSGGTAGVHRSATYNVAPPVQPPAPTPPPIHGGGGGGGHNAPFPPPPDENDARRSSAKPRRGSGGDDPRLSRERSYRDPSREALRDPPVVNASPSSRHAAQFSKTTSSGNPMMPPSPPRTDLPRTKTMPVPEPASSYSRPPPGLSRAQTFSVFDHAGDYPRGRDRSRMQPQVEVESDSEEMYGRRRDRKHRSSRRHHSPEQQRTENVSRYQVDGSRSRLHSSYVRHVDAEYVEPYPYYGHPADVRPSMPARETGYSATGGAAKFPKVKTSKSYGYDDVQYSYYDQPYHEEYAYA
ncbi:hypothetical protein E4U55_004432 [Claviceps digitariae]|nr:hypothetical protein E4U55_004432 [Claviceps digitariae]